MTAAHDLNPVGWFSFEDRCVDERPGRWRHELRPVLRACLGRALADDLLLAASELVSNGVEHGGGVRSLRVSGAARMVTVEVEDRLPVMVERPSPSPDRGRGLAIAEQLADAWGWHTTGSGKVVWARFERHDEAAARPVRRDRRAG